MHDPLLSQYAVVMLDEAHERSLNTDILIGLLKKIQKKRKDLRLVVSSATLDACLFKAFFEENKTTDEKKDTAVILSVEGRQYPVDVLYSKYPVRDYLQATVDTISHIHKSMPSGDILAFLTGKEEIDRVVSKVSELSDRIVALPLYSGLPPEQQLQVFEPTSSSSIRKVIIATNVAEASITLEGIVYVIDAGFSKLKSYDPRTGMGQLIVTPVSQASANQRAGRAGRVRAGKCYRLYTEEAYYSLRPQTVPEMQRENLATVLLQLKALGIDDVLHFNFISPPPTPLMAHALEILYAAGALDKQCKLTKPLGTSLAEFPVEPLLAKMLYASGDMKCSEEMITIAAIPGYRKTVDLARLQFAAKEGDHLTLLNVYSSFQLNGKDPNWCKKHYLNFKTLKRAGDIRKQLRRFLVRFNIPIVSCTDDATVIRRCVVCGFFPNAAQRQSDNTYRSIRGQEALEIHPSSVLHQTFPNWVVYDDVVVTTKKFMRNLTVIEPLWLSELAPHFYRYVPVRKENETSERTTKSRRLF